MHEQIAALAASAATAVVQAMTADGWAALRDRLAGLLGRGANGGPERAAEELERSRVDIAAASDTDRPAVRAGAEALWRERLRRRMEEEPALAAELQQVLAGAAGGRYGAGGGPLRDALPVDGAGARVEDLRG
ncbi:hypothetical protein FZ103_01000 [Streptomonospora sp. PA3]|uniref:hypothetical protein n=1 Tax=Streptomonospora sp. PA3 TaxID=2607326 RepID=UPI0012DEBED5|nr:hypothetical protein [Streptomonospora sp. PA3]MUL39769.1 hypothetical protein [Streptomonospora sp. PA3]